MERENFDRERQEVEVNVEKSEYMVVTKYSEILWLVEISLSISQTYLSTWVLSIPGGSLEKEKRRPRFIELCIGY